MQGTWAHRGRPQLGMSGNTYDRCAFCSSRGRSRPPENALDGAAHDRAAQGEATGGVWRLPKKSAKKNTEPSAACAHARIDAPRRPAKGDLHQAPAIYASHGCHSRAPPSPPSHLRRAQELAAGPAPAHMAAPAPHAVRAAAGGARRGARRLGVSHVVPRRVRACLACGARRGGAVVARRPKQAARAEIG